MEDETREVLRRLNARVGECETVAGRKAVMQELAGRGAPVVPYLLETATENGELLYLNKMVLKSIDGADQALLDIRRNGPGQLRRPALRMLADLGAGHLLDERDREAIQRLVRLRFLDTNVRSPRFWPESWLTVRGDLATIVESLGLHHLHRVPINTGVHAATAEEHSRRFTDSAGRTVDAERIFISPRVEDWRVIFLGHASLGHLFDWPLDLSSNSGEAHGFYNDDYDSMDSFWCIARDGDFRRAHFPNSNPSWRGDPLPFEEEEEELSPNIVAIEMSVMPDDVLRADDVTDGWLATTHPEVTPWHFKGVLPI